MSIVVGNPVIEAHQRNVKDKVKKNGAPFKETYFTLFYMCEVVEIENDGSTDVVTSTQIRQEIRKKLKD